MKTLTVTSTGRTGKQWLAHLKKSGYSVSSWAESVILSPAFDAQNPKKGETFTVAIVPQKNISKGSSSTAQVKEYAAKQGYGTAFPELALLIREAVSDKEIEELGVWYITTLHDPIKDADGDPDVLCSDRSSGGRDVYACWDRPGDQWGSGGAFAFVVPGKPSALAAQDSSDTLSLETAIKMVKEAGYQVAKVV